jgi:hypothetical protein
MIASVIFRKLWLPILTLIGVALLVSSCSFGDDNVGAINQTSSAAPQSTPQVPESMKSNDMGEGAQGPPQGL